MTETDTNVQDANKAQAEAIKPENSSDSKPVVAESTEQEPITQKRFNTVYWQKKQAEREVENLRQELDKQKAQEHVNVKTDEEIINEPTLEQFDYDTDAHSEAIIKHRVKQGISKAFEERDLSEKNAKQQAESQRINQSYSEKEAQYVADNPEYQEVIKVAGNKVFSPHVNQAILHAENGPAIDHYLLSNPEISEKLDKLSVPVAMMELGKISAKLSTQSKNNKITGAPPPIDTVGGGGTPNVDRRFDPNISMEEYYRVSMEGKK